MENDTRAVRYRGRAALQSITGVRSCFDCGRASVLTYGRVGVRLTEGRAGFAGLSTCGRVWLCPVCNSKVMARRALEIGAVLAWAQSKGYRVIWGSLTAHHTLETPLHDLLTVQRSAWRYMANGNAWRNAFGVVGYIRAAELTDGANGWHPHFHPLIVWKGSAAAGRDFAGKVTARWVEGVKLAGGSAMGGNAQHLEVLEPAAAFTALAGYVTKSQYTEGLALEAVWSQGKSGNRDKATQSHWTLLSAISQGLADEVDRWEEVETATKGHRMIAWSRGLRRLAGIGDERSDETLAAEEMGTADDTVCFLTGQGWAIVQAQGSAAELLNVVEQSGWSGLRAWLKERGIDWLTRDEYWETAAA